MLIRYHSGTIGTHLPHSETVTDHLYPSTHVWSHPVLVSTHQEPSASFGVCRRPSGPIETSSELSVCFQQPSGHISYIQGLSETICTHRHIFGAIWSKSAYFRTPQLHSGSVRTIWTHRDIFGAICLHSATIGKHQLHSGSVEDHLDPSRHLRSYLSAFGNHQDTSATFRVCRRQSGPIETSLELSVCFQQPSGHISYIQ